MSNCEPMPSTRAAKACDRDDCPGADQFEGGFGLAGGGYGFYVFCDRCGEIRGKDFEPIEEPNE